MKLLFRHSQHGHPGNFMFRLWSQIELDEEENELLEKYGMRNAILIEGHQPTLKRNCILWTFTLWFFSVILFSGGYTYSRFIGARWAYSSSLSMDWIIFLSIVAAVIIGMVVYHNLRETIYVKDLLIGRHFKCKSVTGLLEKKSWLISACQSLSNVLENSKNWHGTEAIDIYPR